MSMPVSGSRSGRRGRRLPQALEEEEEEEEEGRYLRSKTRKRGQTMLTPFTTLAMMARHRSSPCLQTAPVVSGWGWRW